MLVWRRWIFPILLLIVCAAVAAALVKLAFFPDQADAAAQAPTGTVSAPVVAVTTGDITDQLQVDGTIARDDAITVRSQVEGVITRIDVAQGRRSRRARCCSASSRPTP